MALHEAATGERLETDPPRAAELLAGTRNNRALTMLDLGKHVALDHEERLDAIPDRPPYLALDRQDVPIPGRADDRRTNLRQVGRRRQVSTEKISGLPASDFLTSSNVLVSRL